MISRTIALLFTLLCFLTACQQNRKEEAKKEKTLAQIKIQRYSVVHQDLDSIVLSSTIIKEFDSLGKEASSIYYDTRDSVMMQFENSYTNGNKTRVTWRNRNNIIVRYVNMTYNDDDKIIKSESYKQDGAFVEGYIHQWQDNYRTEKKGPITDSTFKPNSIYTYTDFDEFESLVEIDLANDSLYGRFHWEYVQFDENDEWLERRIYFNDSLTRLERREMKYQNH
ncbi:MAG: hypothetical protein HRT61_21300 [Ekhidna sp.]|nr:hypothetical protein [Ekhidna sp.]